MMTSFWLAIAAMLFVATIFVLVPIIRFKQIHDKSALASDWFLARKIELEKELDAGLFTQDEFNEALKELKLTAKDELIEAKADVQISRQGPLKGSIGIALVVFVLIVSVFYWRQGEYQKLDDWQQTLLKMPTLSQTVLQNLNRQVSPEELRDFALGLRTKLSQKDEPIGWMLLGRTLLAINDLDGAIKAFEKSYDGQPSNVSNTVSYAQALQMKGEEYELKKSLNLLREALTYQPDNEMALLLFGESNMLLERYQQALQVFNLVLKGMAQDDPRQNLVAQRLAFINDKLGLSTGGLSIEVTLAEPLLEKLANFKQLFVFAKVDSMPMPVAVKKIAVTGTSFQLNLSDRDVMLPEFKLSEQEQVNIFARLSLDDNAPAQTGDWQGQITGISPTSTDQITVVINEEVK